MHSQDTREIYFPLCIRGLLHSDAMFVYLGRERTGAPAVRIEQVELEAVQSRRVMLLHWRELTDASQCRQGWV